MKARTYALVKQEVGEVYDLDDSYDAWVVYYELYGYGKLQDPQVARMRKEMSVKQ